MSLDSSTAYVATGEHFNLRPFGVPDIETVGEWFADRRNAL